MAQEIERKFLVADTAFLSELAGVAFKQGYIPGKEGPTVRIRIEGARAVITLKGLTTGISRSEYEYEIPIEDAEEILEELCERPFIDKTRYILVWQDQVWAVDVFAGDNAGLVIAEVELHSEEEKVEKPPWVGAEVSGDSRYYNANLVHNPYCQWRDD